MSSKTNLFKLFFILLLFITTAVQSFEFHILVFLISSIFLLFENNKISKFTFNLLSLLVLIVSIGMLTSLFYEKTFYNWLKDLLYFLKPVLAILTGYLLMKKVNDFRFFTNAIVKIALFFSVYHILSVLITTDFSTASINDIRNSNGISNLLELFALVLLLASYKYPFIDVFRGKTIKHFFLLTIGISFVLYFSRTMYVGMIILILTALGFTKITVKGFKYGMLLFLLTGFFYLYLFSREFKRDAPGIESFLYKVKIAPSEIFNPSSKTAITKDHANLWDHWRAYEANMALEKMNKNRSSYIWGYGFGSLVDLKFRAPLDGNEMRFIPILHNGYVYILFKTGAVGLIIYLTFLSVLYIQSYYKSFSDKGIFIKNIIAGIGLFYFMSSIIITGIHNSHDIYTFILGGLLFLLFDVKSLKEQT